MSLDIATLYLVATMVAAYERVYATIFDLESQKSKGCGPQRQ